MQKPAYLYDVGQVDDRNGENGVASGAQADQNDSANPQPSSAFTCYSIQQDLVAGLPTLREMIFTPAVMLILFTLINFLLYFDRGALSASLSYISTNDGIRGEKVGLTDTESGFIVSGFMIGFIVASPLAASFGGMVTAKVIMFIGLFGWVSGCLMTAFSTTYGMIVVSRTFVGVGEASFVSFSVTIIDNIAPPAHRTLWIGVFYSMMAVGTALGMAIGGTMSSQDMLFGFEAWRSVFTLEAILMLPLLAGLIMSPRKYSIRRQNETMIEYEPIHRASWMLLKNLTYVLIVLGLAMYCFVLGAIAVWAIDYLVTGPIGISASNASLAVGGITIFAGLGGSVFGAFIVDYFGGSIGTVGAMKCQLFSLIMIIGCIPFGLLGLLAEMVWLFVVAISIALFGVFSVTAPVNAAILTVVPSIIRPYAVGYSVFFIHLLGDFPSPTIAGVFSDHFESQCSGFNETMCNGGGKVNQCVWRNSTDSEGTTSKGSCENIYRMRNALMIVVCFLFLTIPCWFVSFYLLRKRARVEEILEQDTLLRREVPRYTDVDDEDY